MTWIAPPMKASYDNTYVAEFSDLPEIRFREPAVQEERGMTVTQLKTVNEDVVLRLEQAIERARAGKTVGVAIAEVLNDGGITRSWSWCDPVGPLIGAVALLQHDLTSD